MLRTRKSKSLSDPHPQSTSQPRLPVANSSFGIRQMQWLDGEPKQKRKRRNDQIRLLLYTLHKLSVCFVLKHCHAVSITFFNDLIQQLTQSHKQTQDGHRSVLDELLTKLLDHRMIRENSKVRARLLRSGSTVPEGASIEDCLYVATRVRDRYKQCLKLPQNSNARRVALQSLYTTVSPAPGDSMLAGTLRVMGTTNKQAKVGLRRGIKRVLELKKTFEDDGNQPLSSAVMRNLTLTGGGTHTGTHRSSPKLSDEQRRARDWALTIWSVDKTPMKGFLRVSPTTRDAVRYRSVIC